ncbi:MAG: EAL domain-containing protein [Xanthobacteraceae bacterium]
MTAAGRLLTFQGLIYVAAGLIGVAVLAIAVTIWGLRQDAIEDAAKDTGNIATVLAEQTAHSVQSIDAILTDIQGEIRSLGIDTPEDFRRVAETEQMYHELTGRLARLPEAVAITLAGSDGQMLNSTRSWPRPSVNISDSEPFMYLAANSDHKLYVSGAHQSRVSGAWTIYFGRRIDGARGGFVGLVSVGVEVTYFRSVYESIVPLSGQAFVFLRTDGTVLVRHPENRAGVIIPPDSPWHRVVSEGGGYFHSEGKLAGQHRLVAVRPVRGYPLVVDVSMTEADVLANWQYRATAIAVGTLLAVLCSIFLLRALSAQVRRLIASEASLAEREARLAEKSGELEQANVRLDAALNNMSQGLCLFDKNERLVICNDTYIRMYGLSPDQVKPGCDLQALLEARRRAGHFSGDSDHYVTDLHERLAAGRGLYLTTQLDDGRIIAVNNHPVAGGGWVATHEDITERQRITAQIAHMARHDALTDLANRVLFQERMDEAIARLRSHGEGFCVFVFDIDLFKSVNDSLGHPIGDALLKAVAQRLRSTVRGCDTVARLGGDEFAILQMVETDQREDAIVLANRLLETIGSPYSIEGHQIVIGVSIGIASAPADGMEGAQLFKHADLALYRAKSEGRNSYRFFAAEMDGEARLRRSMEVDLRTALSRDALGSHEEFELHYQDVRTIATKKVCGAEALLRWRHPEHGLIFPDKFIPIAEEIGLIVPLGEWVIRKACAEAATWPEDMRISVNLSSVQFRTGNLIDIVTGALVDSGLAPERLELEITESVLLQKQAGILGILQQLKSLGVGIVLDDFGTGYSSLSYLRMFPFDKVKIDKSFVAEMATRADCAAIVCAITSLGRSLNIDTTAEGVETQEQFELLRAAGCTEVQGYLFSRPRPASELDFMRPEGQGARESAA